MTVNLLRANNVLRFPIERRIAPTIAMVFGMAPNSEEVWAAGEQLELEASETDTRCEADRETASTIAETLAHLDPVTRSVALDGLLQGHARRAMDACVSLVGSRKAAAEAVLTLGRATTEPGFWVAGVEALVAARTRVVAEATIEAHRLCEIAKGTARAAEIARSGAAWTHETVDEQADLLCQAQEEMVALRKAAAAR